jgi:hypothetical protein
MAHTHKGNWFEENVLEETTGIRYYADPKDRSKQLLTKARVIEHSDQLPAKEYKSVMSSCITNQQDHPNYKTLKDKVGPRQAMLDAKLKQQVADEFTKRAADDYTENRRVRYVSDAMETQQAGGMAATPAERAAQLARIKGMSETVVIWKHCLRNALIPVLTLWGVFVGNLVTGSIVAETVFAWPGVGRLTYEAVIFRDFPLLQAVVILHAVMILAVNLMVDILYAYVDPRIRLT